MKDRDRTATLRLTNRGDKSATYRISLSDVIYKNDGTIEHKKVTPAGFPSARPFVRFSPRQVRLTPGESQRVRILLKNSNNIPNGEYRIHAVLSKIPEINNGKAQIPAKNNIVSGSLGLSQAVAIPVIIQRGEVTSNAVISSAKRVGGSLHIMLSRSGSYSAYTNIEIFSVTGKRAALVKGIAVPVPNRQRLIKIKLNDGASHPPYRIVVKDHDSGKIFAEKTVQ